MDKKTLVGLGLSVATAGVGVLLIAGFKTVRKFKIKRERKQLKRYVKKYLKGDEKIMSIVDNLSNFQIRILFKIIEKGREKAESITLPDIKLPAGLEEKLSAIVDN
ncbi:hypothetical protein [Companilactobacillus mishanensis]|uniref:Uncharacterized protein n=1 Tax=Companilactobacillus mishanensis TaxID=2486008 RepID=A0A5P0ZIN8_9LACO|nr:hypothetical protein [Companilactobacillus mishanensis]MQS52953.1 hypothetical protein [Companilactobacillus mishanensis]MQS89348.1 hypothetical protein [Companilactobacillus mishanensis]